MNLSFFSGPEHRPFYLEAGSGAVMLIHGFPGTPAELRPLAERLYAEGWSARGVLLPGFGENLETLLERDRAEWIDAVRYELDELRSKHDPVFVLGYSMGAAVALNASLEAPPDGLILLSPFWQLGEWWYEIIGFFTRPFLGRFKPLARADFSDPNLRKNIANFFPGADLDDPEIRESLRQMTLPVEVLDNVRAVGKSAYSNANRIHADALILQGLSDEVVPPERTRKLAGRLAGLSDLVELEAAHDLLNPEKPAWEEVVAKTLDYLAARAERPWPA